MKIRATPAMLLLIPSCFAENVEIMVSSSAIFNPKNGHYYEFVAERELTWPEAKRSAESRTLVTKDGEKLRGYLATLTEEQEQALLDQHFLTDPTVHTDVWLGASDEKVDDEWRWVTGPEGKKDGGKGVIFFKNGVANGYANWRPKEPNNSGGIEKFMQWNHYLREGDIAGTWNDQPIDKSGSKGFFVEYGGM